MVGLEVIGDMKMRRFILILCLVAGTSGCGYQFGDGTRAVVSLATVYCNTLPKDIRDAALRRMQLTMEEYPENSICDTNGFIVDIVKPIE